MRPINSTQIMPLRRPHISRRFVWLGHGTRISLFCFFSQFSVIGKQQTSGIQNFTWINFYQQFISTHSKVYRSEKYPSNFRINGKTWVITVIDSALMLCLALIFFSEEDEQTHQVASSIWSRFSRHHICTHTLITTLRLISTQFTLCVEFYIMGSNQCLIDADPLIQ